MKKNWRGSNDEVCPNLDAFGIERKKRRKMSQETGNNEGAQGAPNGVAPNLDAGASRSRGFSMTELLTKKFSGVFDGLKKGTSKAGTLFRVTPAPQPQVYRFNYKVHGRGGYYKKKQ